MFEQSPSWFDLRHKRGNREVMHNGKKESPKKGRERGRWTDMKRREKQTIHTKGCLEGIWWADVCVN